MITEEARELGTQAGTSSVALSRPSALRQGLSLLVRDKAALVSLLFLVVLSLAALFAPVLIDESALGLNFPFRLAPPLTAGHILGCGPLGRDLLSRILMATRVSLALSAVAVALSATVGVVLGIVAGYYGGRFDDLIMRFVDVAMGFPSLLLALIVMYALGPGVVKMVIVLTATRWMGFTRVARAETLRLRSFDYVNAGQAIGGSTFWIMRKHILPNLIATVFTMSAIGLAGVMLSEANLSFLGLGIQPPDASLGLLVAQGREYVTTSWWLMVFPGLAIFAVTMALTLLANWLGIVLDPVQRWRLTSARRR